MSSCYILPPPCIVPPALEIDILIDELSVLAVTRNMIDSLIDELESLQI